MRARWFLLCLLLASAPVAAQHVTPHDSIPDFCASPTITSVASGSWASAATWSPARLPQAGDRVLIQGGHTVTFGLSLGFALSAVCVGGTLTFDTTVSTLLWVTNLMVEPSGALLVGSAANPVPASVTAQIVIANTPSTDPGQYGTGFISMGKVLMRGATKNPTWGRLAVEPVAGNTILTLAEAVTGWLPGDRIVIPDTRHMTSNDVTGFQPTTPQWEERTLASVSGDGKTLTLTAALTFAHLGARDGNGVLDFLPHVGNLTRNVVIRSESAIGQAGTKGHTLFTHRAEIDVRYVTFKDLGRTTIAALDDVTNHIGRYPLHAHHLMGPVTTPANGYQYTLVGNAIDGGSTVHNLKWGAAIHNSHYGLIKDNVAYNWAGAIWMFEDGSESFNLFEHNFAVRSHGVGGFVAEGTEGTGFWFRGPNNYVRGNVAADCWNENPDSAYGLKFFMRYLGNIRVPNFKGADTSVAGQYTTVHGNKLPLLEVSDNEVYCAAQGITWWWVNMEEAQANPFAAETVVSDCRVWHVYNICVYHYPSTRMTIEGLVIRGKSPASSACCGKGYVAGDYAASDLRFRNCDIQGMTIGFYPSTVQFGYQDVEDSYFRNLLDILPDTLYSTSGGSWLPPRHIIVRNSHFDSWPGSIHPRIEKRWNPRGGGIDNTTQLDEMRVYGYQGNAADNFSVYYTEQATQSIAGGLAPCTTTRAGIDGITCVIAAEGGPPADTVPPAPPTNLRAE